MQIVPRVAKFGNTPKELAKAAMKERARVELNETGLADEAEVTVTYMGITHKIKATPTVNVENGQIMFHFGAVGQKRLFFQVKGKNDALISLQMGLGGNLMSGQAIDTWKDIRTQYGLKDVVAPKESDDVALSAGETTE
jgi:hypothetical protein